MEFNCGFATTDAEEVGTTVEIGTDVEVDNAVGLMGFDSVVVFSG
jgi:hypothetical protein